MKNESSKQAQKQALRKTDVSGSLPVEDIKKAIFQFKKECLPDAEAPFHYEAEIWAGIQSFIRWLESKGNDR